MARLAVGIILCAVVNYLLITTIVDMILMGVLFFQFAPGCGADHYLIESENRIDIQTGYQCSAFSSAYLLRHFQIEAEGEDRYKKMPCKMKDGYVYPRGIQKLLRAYGFRVRYCSGNLNALKREVEKGNPVIVMIRVREDKNWLHYVPVVGFDEQNIFLAESLEDMVNCNEKCYNRKVDNKTFRRLWNTSMLRQPLYRNTYMVARKEL